TKKPRLTEGRALLLVAMAKYAASGNRMSAVEVQKIAYFLYAIGALPKLNFNGFPKEVSHPQGMRRCE
ncbi:hypothetical protein LGV96_10085, partial [Streptococcus mutans]|nr:hypothetical protein [Streptococcus mutans]